jgi:hypothetical protein
MIERWTLATFFFASLFHSAFDDMMIDLSIACTCAYLGLVLGVKFDRLGLLLTSPKIKIRNFELRHCIVSIQSIVVNMNQVTLLFYDQQVVYICISRTKKINRIIWEVVSFLLIDLFSRTYKNHFIFKFLWQLETFGIDIFLLFFLKWIVLIWTSWSWCHRTQSIHHAINEPAIVHAFWSREWYTTDSLLLFRTNIARM